jgi:hypothetical protein
MKKQVKVWLRKSNLTVDPKDMTAVLSSTGTINKQGIITAIIEDGTEWQRETIEAIIDRYHRKIVQLVAESKDVNDGLAHHRLTVTGVFQTDRYDAETNGIHVVSSPGAMLRSMTETLEVVVLGEMPDAMHIYRIVNLHTKAADDTITRGRNAEVEGKHIKVVGDDTATGVYLENVNSGTERKLEDNCIIMNNPASLVLLIPDDLDPGEYRLKIVTQYSTHRNLKAPREVVYGQILTLI